MAGIVADITVSMEGFVTGPEPALEHGLGRGGAPLHHWASAAHGADVVRQVAQQRLVGWLRLHIAPVLLGSGTRLLDGVRHRS
jgi:RibD C-terminal domain